MAEAFCVTVKVNPEGCEILLMLEDRLDPESLISKIEESLKREYRGFNSVSHWCFHFDNQTPFPGMFLQCHTPGLHAWIIEQAGKVFGWA